MTKPASRAEALRVAKALRDLFQKKGYPIEDLYLFGSSARGRAHRWSDIDIAVLCVPFLANKHEENVRFLLDSKDVDIRIQTVCMHPEDLRNKFFSLAREVQQYGIRI